MWRAQSIVTAMVVLLVAGSAWPLVTAAYIDGPVPGRTGDFGEMSCHHCHWDAPLNDPAGNLTLAAPEMYTPGERHIITVSVSHPALVRGGVQPSARFGSGPAAGRNAGTLRAEGPLTPQLAGDGGVEYIQHTKAGALGQPRGAAQWTIAWTAPQAREAVIFHAAANASNGDDSPLGDFIFTATATSRSAADHLRR